MQHTKQNFSLEMTQTPCKISTNITIHYRDFFQEQGRSANWYALKVVQWPLPPLNTIVVNLADLKELHIVN